MKTRKRRTLKLTKISIAVAQQLELKAIKGGTEPVSINIIVPMTQAPDEHTVCYAVS